MSNVNVQAPPVGSLATLHSLVARSDLNGATCRVIGSPTENGRVPVETISTKERPSTSKLSIKPECLTVSSAEDSQHSTGDVVSVPQAPVPSLEQAAAPTSGYPSEPVMRVFDPEVQAQLAPPQKKELQKLAKTLPLSKRLFDDVANAQRIRTSSTTVEEASFKRQLEMFTWGLLVDFDDTLWENVLLGGGAVLASLMPPERNFKNLRPLGGSNNGSSWLEFDLYHQRRRIIRDDSEPARTLDQYFRETRWPTADIDLFVYGLDEAEAQAKLVAILTRIQRTIIKRFGVGNDVYFIKTPNTVTVGCGLIGRSIQVILRLYGSKSDILNGFDIDCCCCGYDGHDALITPRCVQAMSTKINTINLNIRGESYECRLLKYVERGFAIGIPLLDNSKRDRDHLSFCLEKSSWSDENELSGDSWARWSESDGLERLLMAENLGRLENGVIERAFPGRQRRSSGHERELKMSLAPYPKGIAPVKDSYNSKDKAGNPIWPATTKLEAIKKRESPFAVTWLEGNMPRKPMTWEKWSERAYLGFERKKRYDSTEYRKLREEREAKEKADRAAELEAARQEAAAEASAEAKQAKQEVEQIKLAAMETEAALKLAKKESEAKAREAAAAKGRVQAQLSKAREEKERLEHDKEEEKARMEYELAQQRAAKERLEEETEDKLCCVCSDEKKNVMFEPCRHVSVCEACAPKIEMCPLCRQVPTRKVPIYL